MKLMIKFYLKKIQRSYTVIIIKESTITSGISEAENDKKIIPFLITIVLINNPII